MAANDPGKKKPTVQVERRRKADTGSAAQQPRAEAPQRQRTPSGSSRPSSSGGSGGAGDGAAALLALLPLLRRMPLWMVICLVLGGVAFVLLTSGGDEQGFEDIAYQEATLPAEQFEPQPAEPTAPAPTATRRPPATALPGAASTGETWLVMLYQDADDKVLEQDIYIDLNEAERVGSSETVQIVAQVDRFSSGFQGDGDWTATRRYYITQDSDLERVSSPVIEDLGEANMADAATLVDFVAWAVQTYPADHYALILSDHGMGWPGGWSDAAPRGRADNSAPLTSALGDHIYLMELDQALGEIRAQTGIEQFDLIGLDACLMAHIEVFAALQPHARYAVASQETEPALGWAYTSFLAGLQANPGMGGDQLGQLIVESYISEDQRVVDDRARAEFLRQGSPMGGLFGSLNTLSARQLAQQLEESVTLTAVDLQAVPELIDSLDRLAFNLQDLDQAGVAKARTYSQSFTNIFGKDSPPSYIDLGNFVRLLEQVGGAGANAEQIQELQEALRRAVIAEKHGPKKAGASGISIYFPTGNLYRNPVAGAQSYTTIADRFAEGSLWDEFLAYHYSGRGFDLQDSGAAAPQPEALTRAPGSSSISISPVSLSSKTAAPDQPVTLQAEIEGQDIGYINLFTGYYDSAANSILVADMDYLESSDTRQVDGVYYPVWPDEAFDLQFSWEPVVFAISDGVNTVPALFSPQSYGQSFEQAVYTVDGLYTFADEGQTLNARLYFSDGKLRQVFGFSGADGGGAPREIIPQPGDRFTVLEKWIDLDASGRVSQTITQEGGTLTFGEQMFTWETLYAAPGAYIIGLTAYDLQGAATQTFAEVTVK
jgi:hypothetical protein